MVVELEQPELGTVRQLGHPVKLSRTPADPTRPAPAFGEHTDQVLAEVGYSAAEIAAMKESGVAAGPAAEPQGEFRA
jgi:crotonobetainyl-CoA:carnitine CoA-transferase CaiB-like acyl-CoA transferase